MSQFGSQGNKIIISGGCYNIMDYQSNGILIDFNNDTVDVKEFETSYRHSAVSNQVALTDRGIAGFVCNER